MNSDSWIYDATLLSIVHMIFPVFCTDEDSQDKYPDDQKQEKAKA